ncbi:hypothetical protein V5799_008289 [Amblyomma americanum]|uniref:Uncharacterized protein n=1 Tax=Amblyomma americanum TaxID=6943 RepID=A0AAQ4FFB5_AMBAM
MSRKRDDPAWWEARRRKDVEFRRKRGYEAHWNQRYASLWQYRVDEARQRRRTENRRVHHAPPPSSSSASVNVAPPTHDVLVRLRTDVRTSPCATSTSLQCASDDRDHWPSLCKEMGLDVKVRICAGCGCPIASFPVPGVSTQTESELKATQTPECTSNRGTQTCDV